MTVDWGVAGEWVGAVAQTVAAVATGWIIWQTRKTIDISERAERLQVFMDFSRTYDGIRERITPGALDNEECLHLLAKKRLMKADIVAAMDLLRLFERQHYLRHEGMVDRQLWEVWKKGISKHFQMTLFQYVWLHRSALPHGKGFSEPFVGWVENTFDFDRVGLKGLIKKFETKGK